MTYFMLGGLWHGVASHVRTVDSYEGPFHVLRLDCGALHRCFDNVPSLMTGMRLSCLACIAAQSQLESLSLHALHRMRKAYGL